MEPRASPLALLAACLAAWALLGGPVGAPVRAAISPHAPVTALGPGLYSVDQAASVAAPDAVPGAAAPESTPCLGLDAADCPETTPSRLRQWLQGLEAQGHGAASSAAANAMHPGAVAFQRPRRLLPHHHHQVELDTRFVHLPGAALDNLPDSEQACEALRNASLLQKVLPVVVEPPCPVKLTSVVEPRRVWPVQLLAAECACAGSSCRARTAYVCTQLEAPVLTVTVDDAGHYHQHSQFVPSGCRCMMARATMPEDDDVK